MQTDIHTSANSDPKLTLLAAIDIPRQPLMRRARVWIIWGVVIALLAWSWGPAEMWRAIGLFTDYQNMATFSEGFLNPSFRYWEMYANEMIVTIQIAAWGTALAVLFGVPFAILASANICPPWIVQPVRRLMDILRATPEIVLALMFVVSVGLGPIAGVLALDASIRGGWTAIAQCRWRVGLWMGSAAVSAGLAMSSMTPETSAYMKRYWAGGFPQLTAEGLLQAGWPWVPLRELFGHGAPAFQNTLFYPAAWLYASLAVVGLVLLARDRRTGWIVVAPVVATAAAAVAQQYPFRDRVILFLLPSLLLGFGAAVEVLVRQSARLHRLAGLIVAVPLLAGVVVPIVRTPPPYNFGDIKPIMSVLRDAVTPTTKIYVHANGGTPFDYYAPQFGWDRASFDLGTCQFASGLGREFLTELDRYRGAPDLWVVLAHMTPGIIGQRDDLLRYLDTIGKRRRTVTVASRMMGGNRLPVEAFHYDLSDPQRLEQTSADTFTLNGSYARTRRTCEDGPIRASTVDRRLWDRSAK